MSAGDLDAVARAVFAGNRYMTLGTADEHGQPWVSPVWFARGGRATSPPPLRRAASGIHGTRTCEHGGRGTNHHRLSSRRLTAARNCAARAPSRARWSHDRPSTVIGRMAIESLPSSSVTTTGRLTTASRSRIAT
jgi:predicted pyridoxine 5'-phosphate oxidase superfamily flavin-nucleotide-binding protein